MSTPDKFMTAVEENTSQLCKWSGELFLEFHNGTYTTQAKVSHVVSKVPINVQYITIYYISDIIYHYILYKHHLYTILTR